VSIDALRARQEQLERERALLHMRASVVAAIAPGSVASLGSSAVLEAVDEALAQLVVAGLHLRDPDQVRALWITAARRRVIDEHRSAERKHRGAGPFEDAAHTGAAGDLPDLTEEARQRWRICEIFRVLSGDQRRWAEAWYDEVLSQSRGHGAQPRGLPEALDWTPAKTKSVSRRARMKMAQFINARTSGAVCDEQRARLDAFIMAGKHARELLHEEHYDAVLFHVAGCEDCWAAWRARRRELLGRGVAVLPLPLDAVVGAVQAFGSKLVGVAAGVHAQASPLLGRAGIGGAAAAGGGVATFGGKATAVCVGVMCAAAAGGEVAGVLPPIASGPHELTPRVKARVAAHPERRKVVAKAQSAVTHAAASAPASAPASADRAAHLRQKLKVRAAVVAPRKTFAARTARGSSAGEPAPTFSAAGSEPTPPPFGASPSRSTCEADGFGC